MKLIINKLQGTKNRDKSLWYGGKVAEIITDKRKYEIEAIGNIRCELIAKTDLVIDDIEYKKDDIIVSVVDKNNSGVFLNKLGKYLKNDEELVLVMLDEHPNYGLEFGNNNWLEVFYKTEKSTEESYVLDCSGIDDAINQVVEEAIKKMKPSSNKYVIYCRCASYSDYADRVQESLCKKKLCLNHKTDKADVFIDNGFSGITPLENPAFSILVNKYLDNKIIYTSNIDRLSRDVKSLDEVLSIIKEKNSDIYIVNENKLLSDYASSIKTLIENFELEEEKEQEREL